MHNSIYYIAIFGGLVIGPKTESPGQWLGGLMPRSEPVTNSTIHERGPSKAKIKPFGLAGLDRTIKFCHFVSYRPVVDNGENQSNFRNDQIKL